METPAEIAVRRALLEVMDPELPVSIVDLGMVYGIEVDDSGRARMELTFTSMGCPAMDMLLEDVERAVREVPGVTALTINVVWSPPWTKARLTPNGRAALMAYGLSV
jgi:metal-sulfur cluster biosynthetic enzyme